MKIKTILQFSLWLSMSVLLNSCSSCGLKGQCEKTNWYQKGFDIAQTGERINNDSFTQSCRKEDYEVNESQLDVGFKAGMAHYCLPDVVFSTGKKGQFFTTDFCDPNELKTLNQKHKDGVAEFCKPESAYQFGAQGGVYNQICKNDNESQFLPEYQKGRKKYLSILISENENRISELNRDIDNLESSKGRTQSELNGLNFRGRVSADSKADLELQDRINSLNTQIRNYDYSISSKRKEMDQIRNTNSRLRIEAAAL
jgi:hypothetical protein